MAEQQKSPFARVSNGYDPRQVAAFAAEALVWKRQLGPLRAELEAARQVIERYESVIGSIEAVEREAAAITEDAERRAAEVVASAEDGAAKILEMAQHQVSIQPIEPNRDEAADQWITPEPSDPEVPDPVEEIFEPNEVEEIPEVDEEAEREKRVAAAAANLWKRRGVLTPPE